MPDQLTIPGFTPEPVKPEETRFLRGHPHQKAFSMDSLIRITGRPRQEIADLINDMEIKTYDPNGRVLEDDRHSGFRIEAKDANRLLAELGRRRIPPGWLSRALPDRGPVPLAKNKHQRRQTSGASPTG